MDKVAILIWALHGGGAERIAGLLSKELEKEYEIYVIVLFDDRITYEYGGQLISLTKKSDEWGLRLDRALKRLKEELRIAVSISFLEGMNVLNICSRTNDTIIISERCTQSKIIPPNPFNDILIHRYYSYADYIVACSSGVKYDLVKNYGINESDVGVVYNFVDKDNIRKRAKEALDEDIQDFIKDSDYYISIGRLNVQKNQEYLIRQFSEYAMGSNRNEKKLIILGSGEEQARLNNLIKSLDAQNYIRIFEYTTNPFKYLNKATALIVTSKFEGLPNVILEAMTIGTPVISTDCFSGPRELLLGITDYRINYHDIEVGPRGILVPEEKEADQGWIKQALVLFDSNKKMATQLSSNAYEYMDSYSTETIKKEWVDIIKNATARKPKPSTECEYQKLDKANRIYIYGAGGRGKYLYNRLSREYSIDSFIVTNDNTEKRIDSLPVRRVSEVVFSKNDVIVIGVGLRYCSEVFQELKGIDCTNIVYLPF